MFKTSEGSSSAGGTAPMVLVVVDNLQELEEHPIELT